MLVWNPDPLLWFLRSESDTDVYEVLSITAPGGYLTNIEYEIEPDTLPKQVELYADLNVGLIFQAPHLLGMFPIIIIRYLHDTVEGDCQDFDDIPAAAEDVWEYLKDPVTPKHFDLTVTASGYVLDDSGSGEGGGGAASVLVTETRHYRITIIADYTPGRDRLKREVDARR